MVHVRHQINVGSSPLAASTFFFNPENDFLWREEINRSIIKGALALGVIVSEYSHLSKRQPDFKQELTCVQFEAPRKIVFETSGKASFFLRSEREAIAINENETTLIYDLKFDSGIVKFALGFALPEFLIKIKAKSDQKQYLRNLKKILEQNKTPNL